MGEKCLDNDNLINLYFKDGKPEQMRALFIPYKCKIYVPEEYLQDYALRIHSKYIYTWNPND